MKKFLRGILCWAFEVLLLPISLIDKLIVIPIVGIYYRINGELDSFEEYWSIVKDATYDTIKRKNFIIKYGFIEGQIKYEECIENEEWNLKRDLV